MLNKKFKSFILFCVNCLLILTLTLLVFSTDTFEKESTIDKVEELKQELINDKGSYDEQQIILENTNKVTAKEIANNLNAKLRISKDGKFAALTLPKGTTISDVVNNKNYKDIIDKFSIDYHVSTSEVEEIEDKYIPKPSKIIPSDEFYSEQTYLDYLNLSNIWQYSKGENITIAVIDTGIDTDHPEFEGKISEYSYNATEDKIVKDYLTENGEYDWSLVEDEQGHGTAVTGVIAASWDNGGIVGLAPNVNIITIKAECDERGNFKRTSDLVFGLYYAIERDVDIVNMSFCGESNVFAEPARLAVDSDIICVAAAGNKSTAELTYPAADPNVIGVGALASNSFELAQYSNFGENTDIVAPGTVYTTSNDGTYKTTNGTSFASPIVAAVLALQKAYDRSYRGEYYQEYPYIKELLYASSIDLGALGQDFYYGYGALDISALILEERKTVSFNYLTDEIDTTTQVFIKNHPLQNIPEPERNYAVFDGWYYDIHCFEEYKFYTDIWQNDITLYCNWGNEDDVLPYTYVELEDGTIEIRSYTGKRRYITIPDYIDGKVVSSIGRSAFENQTRLRVVNLPAQLKIIKDSAFANCINLTSITIPDSVVSIGVGAFYNNIRIYNVNFGPDSKLEIIKKQSFANCANLSRIDLPQNVIFSEINDYCTGNSFLGCTNLKQINAHKNSNYFSSKDGVLFNKSKTTLVVYPAGLTNDTYDLPKSVKKLGVSSFAFSKIETIDLKNVTFIDGGSFQGSTINSIVIPDTVTFLGESAFAKSYISSIELGHGIANISKECFANTSYLKEITIPNTILEIKEKAFYLSSISKLYFEENSKLQAIGKSGFEKSDIISLNLPDSVLLLGDAVFFDSDLINISITANSNLVNIGNEAFKNTKILNINLPSKLTTIGDFAFVNTLLSEVTIPTSVINYSPSAFASCHRLENIFVEDENPYFIDVEGVVYTKDLKTIHEYPAGKNISEYQILSSVEKIGDYSFYGSRKLNNIILPEELRIVGEYGFYDCINVTSYNLPETLTVIERYGFASNNSLNSISIPDNVVQISNYAFRDNYNMYYVYFNDTSKLDRLSYGSFAYCGIYNFRIPSNVSTIAQDVFIGCPNLSSITFASNSKLESVSAYLFKGCNNLQTITFEEGSMLTNIQAHAFEGMDKLQSVDFGSAKITNIDNFAFRYCESLQDIVIPNTAEYIGRYAFFGCKSLSRIDIPSSVEYIGRYAFNLTNELDVYFESGILPIAAQENWNYGIRGYYLGVKEVYTEGNYELAKLNDDTIGIINYNGNETTIDLTNLDFGTITQIGGSAFRNTSIEIITLPETLVSIDQYAFANTNLKTINIPDSVLQINDSAFRNTKLESISFSTNSNLIKIGMYAFANTSLLNEIIVPKKVVSIGSYAFFESGIQKVTFDEKIDLKQINESTFQKSKLTTITIPNSVTLIDHNAFRDILTLQSVNFGTGKLQIMSNVFYNTNLTNVYIPENVEYIGEYAFVGLNNLNSFTVDANNQYYASKDGVLFSKDYKKLIAYPGNLTGTYIVPQTVEVIGFGAFENSKLSSVYFEENINLLALGYRSFYNSNLKSITIPKSVVSIDFYAFAMCKYLETVVFDNEAKLTGIYEGAFYGCINLKNITIPDEIHEISDYSFYGCLSLEKLPISGNSKILGIFDYAFANTSIIELNLPESLLDIGNYAFQGIKAKEIIVPSTNQEQLVVGLGAFNECNELETITLPFIGASLDNKDICWIGYVFGANSPYSNSLYIPKNLRKIIITEGQTIVGHSAFYNIKNVDYVIFPKSIEYIYSWSFSQSTFIYDLVSPVEFEHLGYHELGENIRSIVLGPNKNKISDNAFYGCQSLTSITFTSSDTFIYNSDNSFLSCFAYEIINLTDYQLNLESDNSIDCIRLIDKNGNITLKNENVNIFRYDDFLFGQDINGYSLLSYEGNEINVTLPDSIYGNSYQISNKLNVPYLEIPRSIKYVNFADNYIIKEVVLHDDFISIDDYAFYNCVNLKQVLIPNSVTRIGYDAFVNTGNLEKLIIPNSVKIIEYYSLPDIPIYFDCSFNEWISIEKEIVDSGNIYIRDENNEYFILKSVSSDSFEDITVIESITLPEGMLEIKNYSFSGLKNIKEINLPSTITSIGYGAFSGCESLIKINLPEGLTSIQDYTFSGCKNLREINLPSTITSIGYGAFSGCESLININLPEGLTSIQDFTFNGCKNLREINLPSTITSIGYGAFQECESLININLPEGLTSIQDCTFNGCKNLREINLPSTITSIGYESFQKCVNLKSLQISENIISISTGAFNGTSIEIDILDENKSFIIYNDLLYDYNKTTLLYVPINIKEIIIPNTCINIDVLAGNPYIRSVEFEEDSLIKSFNFMSCTNLSTVILPKGIKKIGPYAFDNCINLKNIVLPEGIEKIEECAFTYCVGLTNITIPTTIEDIDSTAFIGCDNLGEVTNKSNLDIKLGDPGYGYIAYYAKKLIDSNGNVTYVEDYKDIEHIYYNDFDFICIDNNYYLVYYYGHDDEVILPTNINGNSYAIKKLNNIKKVVIPEGVTHIEGDAFRGLNELETVEISSTVTAIGGRAFENCENLKTVKIAEGLKTINYAAFHNCINLSSINLPKSLEWIDSDAFYGCDLIGKWENNGYYIDDHLIRVKDNVTSFDCKSELNSIAYTAFWFCQEIEELGIGNVNKIETLFYLFNIKRIKIFKESDLLFYQYFGYDSSSIPSTLKEILLFDSFSINSSNFFDGLNNASIFVDKFKSDVLWDIDYPGWHNGNNVYYKNEWIKVNFYDINNKLIENSYYSIYQIIRQPILNSYIKNGYTYSFVGWDIDGDGLADSFPATSNTNIEAKAVYNKQINTYKVTYFDKDNTTILYQKEYQYGDTFTLIDAPNKIGYTFVEWFGYGKNFIVTEDINIYSKWLHNGDGHMYDIIESVLPSCDEKGYTKYICSVCGEWYSTDYIESLGHSFETSIIKPSCTELGYDLHTCACGYSYKDNYISENGHSFGEWIVENDSTCTVLGSKYRSCACGYNEVEEIDYKEHEYISRIIEESTCTKTGKVRYTCQNCNDIFEDEISTTEHNFEKKYVSLSWIQQIIRIIADLFFGYEGEKPYYIECNDCGHIRTNEEIDNETTSVSGVCEHNNNVWYIVSESTCLEEGVKYYSCADCGKLLSFENIPSLGHAEEVDKKVEPTCTESGLTEGKHCSVCNEVLVKQEVLESLGHNYETIVTKPTCEGQGYTTYTCHCGDSYVSDYTEATGHTEIIDEAINPTCTTTGLTEGSHCQVCNKVLVEQIEVPSTGHTYESETKLPTCEEQGYTTYTCHCGDSYVSDYVEALGHTEVTDEGVNPTCTTSGLTEGSHCQVCNKVLVEQIEVPSTGHTYESETKLPTCEEQGYTTYTCHCGDCYVSDYVEALGHTEVIDEAVNPTCTTSGLTEGSHCQVCNKVLVEQIEVPSTGHTYQSETKLPTCEEQGFTTYTCHCGDSYVSDYVEALGHTEVTDEGVNPTCTTSGLTEGSHCLVCNKVLVEQIEVPSTGHTYQSETKLPTCEEQGFTTYTCHCGDSYISDYVEALGHREVIDEKVDATCTTSGLTEGSHCLVCNKVLVEQIEVPSTGHTYDKVISLPTCEDQGYTTYTCHCGDSYVSDYVEALGHTEVIDEKVDATCITPGLTEGSHCLVCNKVLVEQIEVPSTGHTYESETKLPTCEEQGYTTYTCHCGDSYVSDYVEALGHDYGDWIIIKEATEEETGIKERICNNCYNKHTVIIPELSHSHQYEPLIINPTCEDQGYTSNTCHCGDSYISDYVEALGHTEVIDEKVDATCTTSGLTEGSHCLVCNKVLVEQIEVPSTGHTYQSETKLPTCEEQGFTTYTCHCGDSYVSDYVEALGHNYNDIVTKPTCYNNGYTTHTCQMCKDTYVDSYIDKLGHNMIIDECVEPTCTETGLTEGSHCSRCKYKVSQQIIPALDHNYSSVITDATCTQKGYTTHSCERCNDSFIDNYTDALGHLESDWIIDKEATVDAEGHKHTECNRCQEVLNEEIITKLPASNSKNGCKMNMSLQLLLWNLFNGLNICFFKKKR